MKKLLRPRREIWGSLDGFLDPRRIHGSKTGRASGRTGRKFLIINGQILHRPPRSSGYPEPIRGNPNLRAETCPSGRTPAKSRTATPVVAASATPMQHPQIVAPCCSVLQRVSLKNFRTSGATPPRSLGQQDLQCVVGRCPSRGSVAPPQNIRQDF